MEVAIVLEEKDDDFVQMEDMLHSFNSGLVVHRFRSTQEFAEWFGKFCLDPPDDEYRILCLLSNLKILGAKHLSLFEKISSYMVKHKFLADGKSRLPILFVARDVDGFNRKEFMNAHFDNILFKPIDPAIWHAKIDWALSGQRAISNEELTKQKPVSPLEMLKDVEIERITELGFRTHSQRRIGTGKIAKYYIPSLKPLGDDFGVYASCTSSEESPNGGYTCRFSFFGLDATKATNIRKLIQQSQGCTNLEMHNIESDKKLGIIVISEEADLLSRLESSVGASFNDVNIKGFENFIDFYSEIDAEKATEQWLEKFSQTGKAVLEFDGNSQIFTKAFLESDPKKEIQEYLGLSAEQLAKFKTVCLNHAPSKQRGRVSKYWSQPGKGNMALVLHENKQTIFLTIEGSESVTPPGEFGKIHVTVRPSTAEEVKEYKRNNPSLPDNISLLLLGESVAKRRDKAFWLQLRQQLGGEEMVPAIVLGKPHLHLFDQALAKDCFSDYLVEPFDQTYLKKKIKYLIPKMKTSEKNPSRECSDVKEIIKVGIQVNIRSFSEISLSVDYPRALEENSFREFVIYIQKDREYEELLAKQIGAEKDSADAKIMINHFTIFGHGDKTNQKIRLWLNEQYAMSVQENE